MEESPGSVSGGGPHQRGVKLGYPIQRKRVNLERLVFSIRVPNCRVLFLELMIFLVTISEDLDLNWNLDPCIQVKHEQTHHLNGSDSQRIWCYLEVQSKLHENVWEFLEFLLTNKLSRLSLTLKCEYGPSSFDFGLCRWAWRCIWFWQARPNPCLGSETLDRPDWLLFGMFI